MQSAPVNQILPDRLDVAATREPHFDHFPLRARVGWPTLQLGCGLETSIVTKVGNHLIGRFSSDYHWPDLGDFRGVVQVHRLCLVEHSTCGMFRSGREAEEQQAKTALTTFHNGCFSNGLVDE